MNSIRVRSTSTTTAASDQSHRSPQDSSYRAMLLKPTCDWSSRAVVSDTGSCAPRRFARTRFTCGRGLRNRRCRELQVVGSQSVLTANPQSNHQRGHHARSELFHRRSSFLVETHILRAQMAANMTATAGQAISTIISTRGVNAAHCIHPSTTSPSRWKNRLTRQPRCREFAAASARSGS